LTYSINNGSTSQPLPLFTGLGAGSFNIQVTDTNGCTVNTNSLIIEPDAMIGSTSTNPSLCSGGTNGSATISVQGGVAPYGYSWSNGGIGQTISNMIAGTYSVTVSDANGCTLTLPAIINNIDGPVLTSITTTNPSCNQFNDGTIYSQITGGVGPFNYTLNGSSQSNGQFAGLNAGNYQLIITDANGCTIDSSINISEPLPLLINQIVNGSVCSGPNGSISLTVTGGTAPYQYSNNNGASYQVSNIFLGLIAGNYNMTIVDSNGCTANSIAQIMDAIGPQITNVTENNASCNGFADGILAITTSGGTSPLSFQINNGPSQTTNIFNNLVAGNYNVTVTDVNGCTAVASSVLTQPQPITINANGTTQLCIGQNATVSATASGGNGGYVFTWNNGVIGSSQTVAPTISTIYSVSVTDSLGCPSAVATVAIGVNPPLQLIITPNDTICEGQSTLITALASGGDGGPYTYSWAGMTSTSPTLQVSPLSTTNYTVSVTDGCSTPFASAVSQVVVNPLPVVDFTLTPYEGCAPLTVNFTNLTNAGSGAQFFWDFGDNNTSTSTSPVHIYTEPGTYGVMLKAVTAAGCSRQIIFPDTVQVWPVPIAQILATPPVASILYPVIQFQDGGVGANSWSWDFGDGSALGTGQSTVHTYELPNNYDVTLYVENQFGCRDTAYTRVTIEEETTLYIPNAFTPNADGINDMFSIYGIGISSGTMNIFNRWGQMIFSTDQPEKGWSGVDGETGSLCQIGVYVYRIEVTTYTGVKRVITGRVTLAL
jgi:gliding motility-associated-like protein